MKKKSFDSESSAPAQGAIDKVAAHPSQRSRLDSSVIVPAAFVLIGAVLLYLVVAVWPATARGEAGAEDAALRIFGLAFEQVSADARLHLVVVLSALLGSYIAVTSSALRSRMWLDQPQKMIWPSLLQGVTSAGLALLAAFVLRCALVGAGVGALELNVAGFAVVGAFMGLYSRRLTAVLDQVWGDPPAIRHDAEGLPGRAATPMEEASCLTASRTDGRVAPAANAPALQSKTHAGNDDGHSVRDDGVSDASPPHEANEAKKSDAPNSRTVGGVATEPQSEEPAGGGSEADRQRASQSFRGTSMGRHPSPGGKKKPKLVSRRRAAARRNRVAASGHRATASKAGKSVKVVKRKHKNARKPAPKKARKGGGTSAGKKARKRQG